MTEGHSQPRQPPRGLRPIRVPQQARSRRTREAILQAATHCFEAQGFTDTTTALVAKQAGIGVGTLYGYFRDKHEIFLELIESTLREIQGLVTERLDPARWDGADPREIARTLIDAIFHSQTVRPGLQRIMWERYFKDEDFRQFLESRREQTRQAIEDFVSALGERGLRRALDPESASHVILNAVQWNATQTYLFASSEELDARAEETAALIVRYVFED